MTWRWFQAALILFLVLGMAGASDLGETVAAPLESPRDAAPAFDELPTYETLDTGAEELRPLVERLLRAEINRTGVEMGWRPNYPIVVTISTEEASAATNAEKKGIPVGYAVSGRSFVRTSGFGERRKSAQVELHLTRANQRSEVAIRNVLAHEWTHVAQGGLSQRLDTIPQWFKEGQAEYQEARRGGFKGGTLLRAIHDQRMGAAVSLVNLGTTDQWNAIEASGKESLGYSRGYAAVRYLAQVYGFELTTDLLKKGGLDESAFWTLLTDRTGLTPEAFDRRIGEHLQGFLLRRSESPSGDVTVMSIDTPQWWAKALLLDFSQRAPCREAIVRRSPLAPTGGVQLSRSAGDVLVDSWTDDGYTMQTFLWVGADGDLSGVLYIDDTSLDCHSGPITYGQATLLTSTRRAGQPDFVGLVSTDGKTVKLLVSDNQNVLCGNRNSAAGNVRTWAPFEATVGEGGAFTFTRPTSSDEGIHISIQGTVFSQRAIDAELRWQSTTKPCRASAWKAELR